jgi:hypothetical protein
VELELESLPLSRWSSPEEELEAEVGAAASSSLLIPVGAMRQVSLKSYRGSWLCMSESCSARGGGATTELTVNRSEGESMVVVVVVVVVVGSWHFAK